MQTTMLPFPYSLSCQSYVDISGTDSVTSSSPSGTPSPPVISYIPRQYLTSFPAHGRYNKIMPSSNPPKTKSFTIEAILGLNSSEQSHTREEHHLGVASRMERRRKERLTPYTLPEPKNNSHHLTNTLADIDCSSASSSSPNNITTETSCTQKLSSHGVVKSKRIRTIFTPEQLEKLEANFERQQYLVGHERLILASALNLSEAQIKIWFQNRRIKNRKLILETQHATLAQLREVEASTINNETEQEQSNPPKTLMSSGHWEEDTGYALDNRD